MYFLEYYGHLTRKFNYPSHYRSTGLLDEVIGHYCIAEDRHIKQRMEPKSVV